MQSNPFNDSVPTLGAAAAAAAKTVTSTYASTPKKDADFRNHFMQNNHNNLNAIFTGFSGTSDKYECINDGNANAIANANADFGGSASNVKNPFGSNKEKKNAWNELNALDLGRLQTELNVVESQSSIFACMNQIEQVTVKAQPKKEIPADFFNDMAKAAFSEFNTNSNSAAAMRHKNNEFFNKIAGFDCVRT